MKKELKELLQAKDGLLQINELFCLRRWTLESESDILSRNGDYLKLEMTNKNGNARSAGIMITSRDTQGIMQEVSSAMDKMMDEYKESLVKFWNGGLLSK